jgi:hypothetical protein
VRFDIEKTHVYVVWCVIFATAKPLKVRVPSNIKFPMGDLPDRLKVVCACDATSLGHAAPFYVPQRGFLLWRLSDAGRRTRGAVPQAAGIRNPSQEAPWLHETFHANIAGVIWSTSMIASAGILARLAAFRMASAFSAS